MILWDNEILQPAVKILFPANEIILSADEMFLQTGKIFLQIKKLGDDEIYFGANEIRPVCLLPGQMMDWCNGASQCWQVINAQWKCLFNRILPVS